MGALPSKPDHRDFRVSSFYRVDSVFPSEYMPDTLIEAESQGNTQACVSFSIELQTAYHELKERSVLERFDQNYIYGYRYDNHYKGEGMYPREAYAVLYRNGIPSRGILPFKGIQHYSQLATYQFRPGVHSNAVFQRVKSYFALYHEREIKTALQHGPVGICIPVYDSLNHCPANGLLPMPNTMRERLHGYHMMLIIGWTKGGHWVVQNSWKPWGDTQMSRYSMAYMPMNYPTQELWGVIDEELPRPVRNMQFIADQPTAMINEEAVELETIPYMQDNEIMLPGRFLAEELGAEVEQDGDIITIKQYGS